MDLSPNSGDNDVLYLNIGGQTITAVQRRLLTSVEGSLLATMFSGRWDDSIAKDKDGNFFLDFPSDLVLPMIDYLRLKSIEPSRRKLLSPTVQSFGGDCDRYEDFIRLMDHYGMTHAVFPTILRPLVWSCTQRTIQPCHQHLFHVVTCELSSFALFPHGHALKIKAFELTLGDVETLNIGWSVGTYSPDHAMLHAQRDGKSPEKVKYHAPSPFGARASGIALEVPQVGNCQLYTYNYSSNTLPHRQEIPVLAGKGAVIRCEREPPAVRWLVNENEVKYARSWYIVEGTDDTTPCFSGKGEWWVSNIDLGHCKLDFSEQLSSDAMVGSAIVGKQ
jgi:hypothetical protein